MKISLPDLHGRMQDYALRGTPIAGAVLGRDAARVVYSAAHVVGALTGGSGVNGSVPPLISSPSSIPSPSVSGLRGSVPISTSVPSGTPSLSQSGLSGSVP